MLAGNKTYKSKKYIQLNCIDFFCRVCLDSPMQSAGKLHSPCVRATADPSAWICLIRTRTWRKQNSSGVFYCYVDISNHIISSVVNIVIWSYLTFRFTPPTHTILAFRQALKEFYEEGGLNGREKRYKENRAVLKTGMAEMGFKELVPEEFAGHIITCFFYPKHENFSFETFYKKLSDIGNYWGF